MDWNDHPNKLEWAIRPRSGVDSAQRDWGIRNACLKYKKEAKKARKAYNKEIH